ncbi:MAG TPA: hypothetical protein VL485_00670 [Ktedonobacteraceae bacterium]|jgi:hypothetical protein|nr:hypothetical protein [Ktedonobacteraceae bacterium]
MTQAEMRILFRVAQWIGDGNRRIVEKIRELAETEENYMIIMRELDRVTGQIVQARKRQAPATLTLTDWFVTLEDFHWKCAYCQAKPFQIMCHAFPLAEKGTTPENCVPACYACCRYKKAGNMRVSAYLAAKAHKHAEKEPAASS